MGLYWGRVRSINKQGHLLGHIKVGWGAGGGRRRRRSDLGRPDILRPALKAVLACHA